MGGSRIRITPKRTEIAHYSQTDLHNVAAESTDVLDKTLDG